MGSLLVMASLLRNKTQQTMLKFSRASLRITPVLVACAAFKLGIGEKWAAM